MPALMDVNLLSEGNFDVEGLLGRELERQGKGRV